MAVSRGGLTFTCPFGCHVWLQQPITVQTQGREGRVVQIALDEEQLRLAVASHLAGTHAGEGVA